MFLYNEWLSASLQHMCSGHLCQNALKQLKQKGICVVMMFGAFIRVPLDLAAWLYPNQLLPEGLLKHLRPLSPPWSSSQNQIFPFSLSFLPLIIDLGWKRNPFINVIVSLCISRFRSDSWKWHRSRYGSFSMPLWQAKMLILPGRRPYTRSSASWTARSQRFSNLPIVCRSFCMSSDFNCLPSLLPSFPESLWSKR